MSRSLHDLILWHAGRDDLARRTRAFYERLDETLLGYAPICRNRGACCRFGAYGHRLYVTTVELAFFVHGLRGRWQTPTDEDVCPYQVDGVCTARAHRPMGCRIFFCDPAAQPWQQDECERQLTRLKAISRACGVDYRYREWLDALREIQPDPPVPAADRSRGRVTGIRPIDHIALRVIQ